MKTKSLLVLALIPGISSAITIPPDGFYNVTETELTSGADLFHDEKEGDKTLFFASPETLAYQYKYNSTNKTMEFNNGSSNDWEYWHEMIHGLSIYTGGANFWFYADAGLDTYTPSSDDSWTVDATYTPMSNLVLLSGTSTEKDEGVTEVESFKNIPFMFTNDADMHIHGEIYTETGSYQLSAIDAGTTNPVNVDESDFGINFTMGLKKGATDLVLADLMGTYHFSVKGFFNYCNDDSGGSCTESVQEGWLDIFEVTFNGDGSCTVPLFLYADFAAQRLLSNPDSIASPTLYADSYDATSDYTACSYSVNDEDNVTLSLTENDNGEIEVGTANFKVSEGHRYLVGSDQFSDMSFNSLGDFQRGTIFGLKMDTSLSVQDFSGTYLVNFQGLNYDNTDDTLDDVTTFIYHNRNFALTFDGSGNCSFKGYKSVAKGHYYPATDTMDIESLNGEADIACSGGYSIVTNGAHQFVKVTVKPEFILQGYLSDNGETISFFEPVAKNLTVNDGLNGNLPSDDFSHTATILKLLSGVAIKYAGDSQSTDAAINAWLNKPVNFIPAIPLLLLF